MRKLYNIGDNFCDENRNYTLINKFVDCNKNSKAFYQYKCNVCGYDCGSGYRKGKYVNNIWIPSSQISRGDGCSCCANKIVVTDINSIFATRKDLLKYFKNIDDAKIYSENSNVYVDLVCPDCGTEKRMLLTNFVRRGFSCPKCSDKISIGEKMIYCLLDALGINFVKELSSSVFKWCENYRYDFYIPSINAIIEVHGKQHYEGQGFSSYNTGKTLYEEINNDQIKHKLALRNGIKLYIIINASESDFNYIKNSILSSELANIYNLSQVDWNYIYSLTTKNLVKEVCRTWDESVNITITETSNMFHLSDVTIRKYLKIGNELGWCIYDGIHNTTHYNNIYEDDAPNSSQPIVCLTNNIYFKSIGLCSKYSENIFGKHIGDSSIRFRINNNNPKSRQNKFDFRYVTQEQFNKSISDGCIHYGTRFI